MNREELIEAITLRSVYPKIVVRGVLYLALEVCLRQIAHGEAIMLSGFGSLGVRQRGGKPTLVFRPGTTLRTAVKRGEYGK